MKWDIQFIEPEKFMKITAEGKYEPEEHLVMMKEILSHPLWKPDTPVLLDNRKLDYFGTDLVDLEKSSADMLMYNQFIGSSKIAFLTNSIENFNIIRQFELITEEEVSAWMQVFLDENQALRWLLAYRIKQDSAPDLKLSNHK